MTSNMDALAFSPDAETNELLGLFSTEINPTSVDKLNTFLAVAANIQEAQNPAEAALILSRLSKGLAECGSLLAAASFHMNQARAARKKAEAVVALEEFPRHVAQSKARGVEVKSTDKMAEHFVNQHTMVLEAKEREAFFEALYEKLSINRNVLQMAISSAKAIAFGYRDSSSMSSTASGGD